MLGLFVILVLFLGFGYTMIWDHFFHPKEVMDSKSVLTFLFGGATMFAPYLANQLREAFSTLFPPRHSRSLELAMPILRSSAAAKEVDRLRQERIQQN